MYCAKCGSEIVDGAVFCHNCGFPVERVHDDSKTKRKEKAFNVKKYVISMRVAIPLLIFMYLFMIFSSPTGAAFGMFITMGIIMYIGRKRLEAIKYGVSLRNPEKIDIKTRAEQAKLNWRNAYMMFGLLFILGIIASVKMGG